MPGDDWRWDPAKHVDWGRSSIDVIEPAEPRLIPHGARRVAFGFSRALEQDTIDALDCWDREHQDGWADHAAALTGEAP